MNHLVVVSNRLSLPGQVQTGGLASALVDAMADAGGTWIGWSGEIGDGGWERVEGRVRYRAVDLSDYAFEQYYLGFSNRVLWPLLHSRLDLMDYEASGRQEYLEVNRRFAAQVMRDDDARRVWVHDYHLLPLAHYLRRAGTRARLGFFLHTPFPSPDIARSLPGHEQVFGALREYDLVGVQTERDADHLRTYLASLDGGAGRTRVQAFPIGIDPEAVAAEAVANAVQPSALRLKDSLVGRKLVISVDRLDYSKGLPARFTAVGRMFERHPELRHEVSFLQIAPVSRGEVAEYKALKKLLDRIAGDVNGRHGSVDWVPLRYVTRSHPRPVIAGYFRHAAVGLVTPLRDGMNLVAKEYVAAQDPENPGVLVLSEFAGAAERMQAALLVNPFDPCAMADTLADALRMPLAERRERWDALRADLSEHSLDRWRRDFLSTLDGVRPPLTAVPAAPSPAAPAPAAPAPAATQPATAASADVRRA